MGIDLNYRQALGALAQAEPSVLEIGPFWCPSVRGDNVRYFDVIGRDDLVQKAIGAGVSPEDVPGIHYVSQDSDGEQPLEIAPHVADDAEQFKDERRCAKADGM